MTTTVGVALGRFQVARLTEGHIYLIEQARAQHRNVVVLIGSSQEWGTARNPLSYTARERMIRERFPDVTCCPMPDVPGDNKMWSDRVDTTLAGLGFNADKFVIYGGRDSFAPYYEGTCQVVECDGDQNETSGSAVREMIGKTVIASEDWRRGVIWATQNPPREAKS